MKKEIAQIKTESVLKSNNSENTTKDTKKSKKLVVGMGIVILVLIGILTYSIVVKPIFENYIIEKQIETQNQIIALIVNEVIENGYIQIPVGDEVLTLVPYQEPTQTNTQW